MLRRCWLVEINNRREVAAAPFWMCKVDFSPYRLSLLHVHARWADIWGRSHIIRQCGIPDSCSQHQQAEQVGASLLPELSGRFGQILPWGLWWRKKSFFFSFKLNGKWMILSYFLSCSTPGINPPPPITYALCCFLHYRVKVLPQAFIANQVNDLTLQCMTSLDISDIIF